MGRSVYSHLETAAIHAPACSLPKVRPLHRARHALRCGNGGISVLARMENLGRFRFRQGFSVTRGRGKIVLGETGGGEGVISTGDAAAGGQGSPFPGQCWERVPVPSTAA